MVDPAPSPTGVPTPAGHRTQDGRSAIDWGPPRAYNLDLEDDRRILCERVLREASSTAEVCQWVNGAALLAVWSELWLPHRLRRVWEDAFPQLCAGSLIVDDLQGLLTREACGRSGLTALRLRVALHGRPMDWWTG